MGRLAEFVNIVPPKRKKEALVKHSFLPGMGKGLGANGTEKEGGRMWGVGYLEGNIVPLRATRPSRKVNKKKGRKNTRLFLGTKFT